MLLKVEFSFYRNQQTLDFKEQELRALHKKKRRQQKIEAEASFCLTTRDKYIIFLTFINKKMIYDERDLMLTHRE